VAFYGTCKLWDYAWTECSLTKTIKAPDRVFGLAVMDQKLYVLRQRPDKQIYVYTADTYELTDDYITLPGFSVKEEGWNDMTECEAEKCLFVSDFNRKCILKVCLKGEPKVTKFADLPYPPKGLSITPDGALLVSCDPDKLVELNVKTGEKVSELKMQSDIVFPKHAVKRRDKQYVVSYDVKDGLHRVCIVAPDGYSRHCYGGTAGPGDLQLHTPCYLELCADDHVVVADNDNGRIVLLNSALEFVRYLLDFHEPHRLFFDPAVGRLYVGECTNGNVKVFQVVYNMSR